MHAQSNKCSETLHNIPHINHVFLALKKKEKKRERKKKKKMVQPIICLKT
jgi:hypothetical protein